MYYSRSIHALKPQSEHQFETPHVLISHLDFQLPPPNPAEVSCSHFSTTPTIFSNEWLDLQMFGVTSWKLNLLQSWTAVSWSTTHFNITCLGLKNDYNLFTTLLKPPHWGWAYNSANKSHGQLCSVLQQQSDKYQRGTWLHTQLILSLTSWRSTPSQVCMKSKRIRLGAEQSTSLPPSLHPSIPPFWGDWVEDPGGLFCLLWGCFNRNILQLAGSPWADGRHGYSKK